MSYYIDIVLATTSTECIACEGVLTGIKEFFVLDVSIKIMYVLIIVV